MGEAHWLTDELDTSFPVWAKGLEPIMQLNIGVRAMLRRNLWVNVGLVNGALSTVRAIVYAQGENPPALTMHVLVEFDDYAGP